MNALTHTIAIPKDTVAQMPVVAYEGGLSVIDTPESAREAFKALSQASVIGFDTETRPSFQKGRHYKVSLMQLSTGEHCYLIRLNKIGFPEALRKILEDPEIIKIGASVHDDFSVMRRLCPELDPQVLFDLQEYV